MPTYDEKYWHEKHPVKLQLYRGRHVPGPRPRNARPGNYLIDIRRFVWQDDLLLKSFIRDAKLAKKTIDDTALSMQSWVAHNIVYAGDEEAMENPEFWLFPAETLVMRRGDCEDGALLMASLILNAIPESEHWRVRVVGGLVQGAPTAPLGGHMWVTYFRESDNQPVILDWCYLEDSGIKVKNKPRHDDNGHVKETWFSSNHKYTWAHEKLKLAGRLRK